MTEVTRRKFIKGSLTAAGAAALYACGFGRTNNLQSPGGDNPIGGARGRNEILREPGYLALERSGELARREQILWKKMERCDLCPRLCHVNRMAGEKGYCGVADTFRVANYGPDFGNERPIGGSRGSGSVFLSNCPMLCIFCQNWEINHRGDGRLTDHQRLAQMLLSMQRRGTHNVSFITPTHLVPHLVTALRIAIAGGLNVPLCYNTGGYDSLDVVKLLDGVVDIYQPDFKFQCSDRAARVMQGVPNYVEHTAAAIKEMYRQVGPLNVQPNGLASHGVVVRHLVLPENYGGADRWARWIVDNLGTDAHVNIMGQFWPAFRSNEFPPLNRRVTRAEYQQAVRWAREAGIRHFH